MVGSKQLQEDQRERVQEVLLTKHRHQHDKKTKSKGLPGVRSIADIGRKHSAKNLEGTNIVIILYLLYFFYYLCMFEMYSILLQYHVSNLIVSFIDYDLPLSHFHIL